MELEKLCSILPAVQKIRVVDKEEFSCIYVLEMCINHVGGTNNNKSFFFSFSTHPLELSI